MNKLNKLLFLGLSCLFVLTACTNTSSSSLPKDVDSRLEDAKNVYNLFLDGSYSEVEAKISEDAKDSLSEEKLKEGYEQVIESTGVPGEIKYIDTDNNLTVSIRANGDKKEFRMVLVYSSKGDIVGLYFSAGGDITTPPKGIVEEDIIIGEGGDYPLKGKITYKEGLTRKNAAVILVHGSGPNDMNESVGNTSMFSDLAYGLAEQGIVVIRYDKRTYAYGGQMSQLQTDGTLTVEQETIEDAILAKQLAESQELIDPNKIYLLGHSMGGMLAPRIDKEADSSFAGLIIMAGSPQKLWEIMKDQNDAVIASMDDGAQKTLATKQVKAEVEKAQNIDNGTLEEAKGQTAFNLPGVYIKDMDSYDASSILNETSKPVLIMQGTDDFQVSATKDFVMYKTNLTNRSNTVFKLYQGLNHLLMVSKDPGKGTTEEYKNENNVDTQVIKDIAEFINSNQ